MVTTEEEITRRLTERDTARSARRAQAATTVGDLARQHATLASQLADLEHELGDLLTAASDVIDLPELAQVTDIPVADLTRWRDQAAKPARGKRKRTSTKKDGTKPTSGRTAQGGTSTTTAAAESAPGPSTTTAMPAGAASA